MFLVYITGTTAHVGIRLVGEYGKSARQHVIKTGSFKRNCSDTFIIAYDVNLGDLNKIQIWHDNRGTSPSWYLSHVIVNDLQTDHKFYFFGNTWLSLEQENGTIQKELKVAGNPLIYQALFGNLFGLNIVYCKLHKCLVMIKIKLQGLNTAFLS